MLEKISLFFVYIYYVKFIDLQAINQLFLENLGQLNVMCSVM